MVAGLWQEYIHSKQTLLELAEKHGRSARWIWQQFQRQSRVSPKLRPRPTVIIADGFFFNRGSGMMLFRSPSLSQNLYWFPISYETIAHYSQGIWHLEDRGWTIQAVVCDGRQGVKKALSARYPVQMCHFHQVKTVTNYLTRHPQLSLAIELRALTLTLKNSTEKTFSLRLETWYEKWQTVIKERTTNPDTKRWWYTHRRVRSAYRSLKQNLSYLFTYLKYPELNIPNTTNSLDGSISHLRDKLRPHRGLHLTQRLKITEELLRGKSP